MGYGYDSTENIGVDKCCLSEFFQALKGQLQLITGIVPMPEDLTLDEVRRASLVIALPGVGKTSGIISIKEELNAVLPPDSQIGFKKIMLGQQVVGALTGIPVVNPSSGQVITVQPEDLPNEERDGKYGILFFDEVTTADDAQVQPALGLTDDSRNIGTYTLPENWIVVLAGNGPDCANFLELHDMTLNRLIAYDISYDYVKDWRPWAHAHGINDMILAFLNFKPEYIVQVQTGEADKSGKQFPSPRSWTRLSSELKIRAAVGRPVSRNELQGFASRIIGSKVAVEFAAFTEYNTKLEIDPNDIITGKISKASPTMKIEEFHIILQKVIKLLTVKIKEEQVGEFDFTVEAYSATANVIRWILSLKDFMLDKAFNGLRELVNEIPEIAAITTDDENFPQFCPELNKFYEDYAETLNSLDVSDIENM